MTEPGVMGSPAVALISRFHRSVEEFGRPRGAHNAEIVSSNLTRATTMSTFCVAISADQLTLGDLIKDHRY